MKSLLSSRLPGVGVGLIGLLLMLSVTALGQVPARRASAADPMLAGGKKLVSRLAKAADRRGLVIQPEHTVTLLREDAVVIAAPLDGTEAVPASAIPDDPASALPIAFAYLALPVGSAAGATGVPAGFYLLKVHRHVDPGDGYDELRLVLEDAAGVESPFGPGVLVWSNPAATPDRSFTRADVSLHEQDIDTPPEARQITIRIWIEVCRWRGCWEKTINL